MASKCKTFVNVAITLVLLGLFLAMSMNEVWRYEEHHTATSTDTKTETDIEFPAVTICDNHYRHRDAMEDYGMPRHPFARPAEVVIDPIYE